MKIILHGTVSDEKIDQIKELLHDTQVEMDVLRTATEMESVLEKHRNELAQKRCERDIAVALYQFMALYAIEFKKHNVEVPSYVRISVGQEYNDDDYDACIGEIVFYDENKEFLSVNFEVEVMDGAYEEDLHYVLQQYLEQDSRFDLSEIEEYVEGKLIPILL